MLNQSVKKEKAPADSAKGPLSGYLFQFELALLELAKLEHSTDFISLEAVDDVATHSEDGSVLLTLQAKHSISGSGSTYEDTSAALWRTFELWINKLEKGILNEQCVFTCCTNKKVPPSSLLVTVRDQPFDLVIRTIEELQRSQQEKLQKFQEKDPSTGASIRETIRLIKFVMSKKDIFQRIKDGIKISDGVQPKEQFLNSIHMGSEKISGLEKDRTYDEFYGWICQGSQARWKNGAEATFTKKGFDDKYYLICHNPAIINAIFRTKESLGTVLDDEIMSKRSELFVRQIEDLERKKDAKERAIKKAILDFIYADIELKYIIDKGDFTQPDFDAFLELCCEKWQELFDEKIIYEANKYSEEQKNQIGIELFDAIMNKLTLAFKDGFRFTTSNAYMQNGSFLKLSNIPAIGWHPDWETKYKPK